MFKQIYFFVLENPCMHICNLIIMITTKKISLFLISTALVINVFAQKPKATVAEYICPPQLKKNSTGGLIKGTGNDFLIYNNAKHTDVFVFYDAKTLKQTGTLQLPEIEKDGRTANSSEIIYKDGNLIRINAFYDKSNENYTVYGEVVDKKGKTVIKEKKLANFNARKKKFIGNISYYISPDKSKILIVREPPEKRYEENHMELSLVSSELNKIYEKNIEFPFIGKNIDITKVMLSDSGKAIVTAQWLPTRDEIKADPSMKDRITFKIFGIFPNENSMRDLVFTQEGKQYESLSGIENTVTGKISFIAIYRNDDKKYSGANSILYFEIDQTNWEIENKKSIVLSKELISEIYKNGKTSEKAEKKADKIADKGIGLIHYELTEIYTDSKDNLVLILEYIHVRESCTTDPRTGTRTCTTYYLANQIIQLNLNDEAEITDYLLIPKKQEYVHTSQYNHFISLAANNKIYYFYNDNNKNHNLKKLASHNNDQYYFSFGSIKKSRLTYVTSASEGNNKKIKKAMFPTDKENISILVMNVIYINPSLCICWGKPLKGKKEVLMKIEVPEEAGE